MSEKQEITSTLEAAAGNGLLHRRLFLTGGATTLGAGALGLLTARPVMPAPPPDTPEWMKAPGAPLSSYGQRSRFEEGVQRHVARPAPGTTGAGVSRTPLERLTKKGLLTSYLTEATAERGE